MSGYVNFTLATSPYQDWLSEGKEECRYRAFRDSEGSFTPTHWKILAVKLAFVIVFEVRKQFNFYSKKNFKFWNFPPKIFEVIKILSRSRFNFTKKRCFLRFPAKIQKYCQQKFRTSVSHFREKKRLFETSRQKLKNIAKKIFVLQFHEKFLCFRNFFHTFLIETLIL